MTLDLINNRKLIKMVALVIFVALVVLHWVNSDLETLLTQRWRRVAEE